MSVALVISTRARREIAEAEEWWLANRDKAPKALEEELARAFELILETPHVGELFRSRRRKRFIRRVLLHRTKHYLYYRATPHFIEVLALWHSSRRPPSI